MKFEYNYLNKLIFITRILTILIILSLWAGRISAQGTTIDQKISIVSNALHAGGEFVIEYQIKGTDLTEDRTLATLNADLVYDSSMIRFVNYSDWLPGISSENGYIRNITNNYNSEWLTNSVRISIAGFNVNKDNSNSVKGFDIQTSYSSIVRLHFIILDVSKFLTITVKSLTNQTGLFNYLHNNPNTFDINDITLSEPINLVDTPLPVEILNFTNRISGYNVKLNWTTSTETNNKGFQIERMNVAEGIWKVIGFVEGAGNSGVEKTYEFNDMKLNTGRYKYRMKQIDFNGNYNYLNLNGEIVITLPKKFNLSQNYPNPFNPATKMDYELPVDCKVRLVIYDVLGREIKTIVNDYQSAGLHSIDFDAKQLASGFYYYSLKTNSNGNESTITKKMMLVK